MKKIFNNINKQIFVTFIIFEILTLVSLFTVKNLSFKIAAKNTTLNAFYWLSPSFSVIQTCNSIASWGSVIAMIAGCLISKNINTLKNWLKTLFLMIKINFIFIINSCITTFIYEFIYFHSKVTISPSIIIHSILIFIATLFYLIFWCCLGLGLNLILKNKILSVLLCIVEQFLEYFIAHEYIPQSGLFLPYSLSREIITRQFPFWDSSTWASINNTVAYANTTRIVNKYMQPIKNVSYIWIISLLAIYLIIIYLKPVISLIIRKEGNKNVI